MILGVGSDIVSIARVRALHGRYGARLLRHILTEQEHAEWPGAGDPGRWLAKRFAAKEAFSKALGTGLRAPVSLRSIAVTHDTLGKPGLVFGVALQDWLTVQGVTRVHLSLSDEAAYALAFVVTER